MPRCIFSRWNSVCTSALFLLSVKSHFSYILLEYFDCGSLANLISVSGPIPERITASFSKQLLEAINYCHKQHYIHRDLKPSNFLVNSKGIVKLADFGTSSRLQGNTSAASTWVGTVTYMSVCCYCYSYFSLLLIIISFFSLNVSLVEITRSSLIFGRLD